MTEIICTGCETNLLQSGFDYEVELGWEDRHDDEFEGVIKYRRPELDRHRATCWACNRLLDNDLSLSLRDWFLTQYGIRFDSLHWDGWPTGPLHGG